MQIYRPETNENASPNEKGKIKMSQNKLVFKTLWKNERKKKQPLHSKYSINTRDLEIDATLTHQCHSDFGLNSQNEGFIIDAFQPATINAL